jgi:long-chain acyl-CoA synthetase
MNAVTANIVCHAARTPARPALIIGQDRLTWWDLAAMLDRLAAHFATRTPAAAGIALHLPNGPALALLFLAAAKAGREAQVLDPDWPAAVTDAALAALRPSVIVTADARLRSRPNAVVLADPALPFARIADALGAAAQYAPPPDAAGHLPFYVGFTSGSTGAPKFYRRDHLSWVASFRGDAIEFGIGPDDVVLAPGALAHSLFLYAMVHGLHVGATVVLCRHFRPAAIPDLIRTHNVSVLYGVPTHLRLILEAALNNDRHPEVAARSAALEGWTATQVGYSRLAQLSMPISGKPEIGADHPSRLAALAPQDDGSLLNSVRWVLSSGAKWFADALPDLRRLFPASRFAEFYGASELSFVTVAKDDEPVPPDSVGRAFPGVSVSIRDRAGRRLPPGRVGRVFVESPLLFSGYAVGGEHDLYRAGNAVCVGDRGRLDVDGFLYLVGREKRMIVTSGKNIFPEEIERVLESHPAVAAAAVLGMPDAKRGERLVALLSLRTCIRTNPATLIAHLRRVLPLYKVPRVYGAVSAWPRTASGKSDFAALRLLWNTPACERLP